jgi:hypothetical protein
LRASKVALFDLDAGLIYHGPPASDIFLQILGEMLRRVANRRCPAPFFSIKSTNSIYAQQILQHLWWISPSTEQGACNQSLLSEFRHHASDYFSVRFALFVSISPTCVIGIGSYCASASTWRFTEKAEKGASRLACRPDSLVLAFLDFAAGSQHHGFGPTRHRRWVASERFQTVLVMAR